MLIVPLIIEKIYRHQVLAKFNSNSFWRTLYRIGFMRRYLHRVAGGKLMKLFGGVCASWESGVRNSTAGPRNSCSKPASPMPSATG